MEKPTRWITLGWGLRCSNLCAALFRFAYTLTHAPLQQQQQGMEFVIEVIVAIVMVRIFCTAASPFG